MNNLLNGIAIWKRALLKENNAILDSEYADKIVCREWKRKTANQRSISESMVAKAHTLVLATSDRRGKEVQPDDSIIWKGYAYSVLNTDTVPSAFSMGAEEYLLYLE